ncbi:MAG TPA: glycosyl hydrolase family 28-related protein, partial [Candidatus Saccharimonadales bacterium]|nr:glycosyl hydrolase family 28-related protein [Candidatus Saccharimonadales bacterium]
GVDVMGVLNKKRASFRLGHASPNQNWAWVVAAVGVLAVLTPLRGAIIPDDRRITWVPGVPGGIPSRPVIFSNVKNAPYGAKGDGVADDTAAIQNALRDCPSNLVVYLPAGTYRINSVITLNGAKTLRGAGPSRTVLRYQGTNDTQILAIRNNTLIPFSVDMLSGYTKGSTNVVLADASGLAPGNTVLLDQLNDGTFVNKDGLQGCDYCSREDGNRALGQLSRVTARNGNEISFQPALYWTYAGELRPQVSRLDLTTSLTGIEDLKLVNASGAADYNILMESAGSCWLKNIESANCQRRHVWTYYALQCEIRDCYFHDGQSSFGPDHGYGVLLGNHSAANLVENNIFASLHVAMQNDSGSSGNVWGYNFVTNVLYIDPQWLQPDCSTHGAHPMMNLWEGNWLYKIYTDWIHGSASHNTYFRNYAAGWQAGNVYGNNAFGAEKQNTYMNVVGNVFGTLGKSDTYELFRITRYNTEITIFELGYTSIGSSGPDGDGNVEDTLLRHGNFDYVHRETLWDPNIAERNLPASLYLSARPRWWGSLPWPVIGPDLNPIVSSLPARERFAAILSGVVRPSPPQNLRVVAP